MVRSQIVGLLTALALQMISARPSWATEMTSSGTHSASDRLSSFLELSERAQLRTATQWQQLMSDMKAAGIKEVILSWAQYDGHPINYLDPIKAILIACKQQQITILIGLSSSSRWWSSHGWSERYLDLQLRQSLKLATQIYPLVANEPIFLGWYIAYEAEAVPMPNGRRKILFGFYRNLSKSLKQLSPGHLVTLSGYKQSPLAHGFNAVEWWQELLNTAEIDRFYFQDGHGVNRQSPISSSNALLHALARQQSTLHAELWVVIEAFQQKNEPGTSKETFHARSTTISRLCQQVKQAQQLDLAMAFYSFDDYMHGEPSSEAAQLGKHWQLTQHCQQNGLSNRVHSSPEQSH